MATLSTLKISNLFPQSGGGYSYSVDLTNVVITKSSIEPVELLTDEGDGILANSYTVSASTGTSTIRPGNLKPGENVASITAPISTVSLTIYVPVSQVPDLTEEANVTTNVLYAKGSIIGTWSAESLDSIGIE